MIAYNLKASRDLANLAIFTSSIRRNFQLGYQLLGIHFRIYISDKGVIML
jgi:hypothetical protein